MKNHFHPVRVAPEASAKIGCRPLLLLATQSLTPASAAVAAEIYCKTLEASDGVSYNLLGRESYYSLAACSAGEKCLKRPWSAGEGTKRFPQGLKIRRKFDTVGNVRRESVLKGHVHVTCPKCLVFWTPSPLPLPNPCYLPSFFLIRFWVPPRTPSLEQKSYVYSP